MHRYLVGLVFMIALALFVRHQFQLVARRITSPQSGPTLFKRPSDGPHTCPLCGGTGRSGFFYYPRTGGPPIRPRTDPCPTCNGTGWIDGPQFGR